MRSDVLSGINCARPLTEIIALITELLSYKLGGAYAWCQLADGQIIGQPPTDLRNVRIIRRPILSHAEKELGTLFAAVDERGAHRSAGPDAFFNAAQLASLAIETGGLYSDLVYRSQYDPLTDVRNRFSLENHLDSLIGGGRKQDSAFGLIYLDIDNFKQVNDHFGHRVGDLYLQEVARRFKSRMRPGDLIARIGGDEFAIVIGGVADRTEAQEVMNRLQACFTEDFNLNGRKLHGHASFGLALYPSDGTTQDDLLAAADSAMYKAKYSELRNGKQIDFSA